VLEPFLGVAGMEDAARAAKPAGAAGSGAGETVLLTGACGYLGRFLCLEWLERVSESGGRVLCLVRAADARAARRRLDAAFGNADPALTERYRSLAARHLEVLNGELTEPGLGLGSRSYDRLVDRVDRIVHPAALVNHRLSYRNLFEPNVIGTAALIRFALTRRQKHFDFISSIAVTRVAGESGPPIEDADVRDSPASVALSERYASGYAASKWAGEVLLRDAHAKFGLPVNVFRADMILAHRRYRGQINVADMFSRLLYSVVRTGLAPRSFYRMESGGGSSAHYDGLPVDFVAGAIVGLGAAAAAGFRTFNVVNPHTDDGISLDRIMDWISSAGYRLQRIPDHARWFERFGAQLRALPELERQHSAVAILDAFAEPYPARPAGIPSGNFVDAVRTLPVGPEVPHLSEPFIHKCLDDLRELMPVGSRVERPVVA
jgi:fatty acid CoA ligase FadD9